jgi:hypothetical protein
MKRLFPTLLASLLASSSHGEAASFQDLNFDSANTNNIFDSSGVGDYSGLMSELMPGWTLVGGTNTATYVGYNRTQPGSGYATVVSPAYVNAYPVVESYSFGMLPKYDLLGTFVAFSLSQSGDLPSDAQSIHFLSYGAPLELQVNGTDLSLDYTPVPSQWNPGIPVFDAAGDISSFAGQNVELKFTTLRTPNYQGLNGLDEIYFSNIPVPEPAPWVVFSLGGLALVWFRHRRKCGKQ